jgi:hypothetical protein
MTISGIFDLFADEQISQRIALKCVGLAFRKYRAKEMRWIFALVAILISVAAVAAAPRCDQFPKERKFVQQLYAELRVVQNDSAYPAWSLHLPAYDKLLKSPAGSACWLVRELREIHLEELTLQQARVSHPVWAIRMLRRITNCKEFLGTEDGKQVPFFSTWMSRDVVFTASAGAQKEVIDKWQEWYENQAATFEYLQCENTDDWYI